MTVNKLDPIPSSVDVLGVPYEVVRGELDGADGEIDPRRQRITLDPRLSGAKLEQTFLHELVHGIFAQLGCKEEYEDERLVQGLAIGLHQALWKASPSS